MKYKPLSREFLLKRGYCCDNNCKNCPYKNKNIMWITTTTFGDIKIKYTYEK
jgi:hypothetical protein|tara:strand:+ start:76 stop:231 length:156 start_codon:yes stop_codon:yes gene_type:complete